MLPTGLALLCLASPPPTDYPPVHICRQQQRYYSQTADHLRLIQASRLHRDYLDLIGSVQLVSDWWGHAADAVEPGRYSIYRWISWIEAERMRGEW